MQPLAALSLRLARAGNSVRLITHPMWEYLARGAAPIEFVPLESNDPREVHVGYQRSRPRSLFGKIAQMRSAGHDYGDKAAVLEACRGAEAVLFSLMYWPAAHIAEYLDVPCAAAYVAPLFRTGAFPWPAGPAFLLRHSLGATWNRLTHSLFERSARSRDLPWLNDWRRHLGLRAIRDQEDWAEGRQIPRLYGHSAAYLPKPADWPPWHHVTGYWFWTDEAWEAPAALAAFLDSRAPTAFIGFSSSIVDDPGLIERVILPAVRRVGCRAVIGRGWSTVRLPEADDVFVLDTCPYEWLFPRVSVVVHASGASTVGEVLRSGKPSVCMPKFGDQRFHAARLERLGVAPRQLSPEHLSIPRLSRALREALGDEMQSAARAMGCRVRDEDGAGRAVQILEKALA
jgi:UDP:flavonoid glycosyltransferase YjiC (YdhE family)